MYVSICNVHFLILKSFETLMPNMYVSVKPSRAINIIDTNWFEFTKTNKNYKNLRLEELISILYLLAITKK